MTLAQSAKKFNIGFSLKSVQYTFLINENFFLSTGSH